MKSGSGLHWFELDTATRRMICAKCGGVMNECAAVCPGRKPEPPPQKEIFH